MKALRLGKGIKINSGFSGWFKSFGKLNIGNGTYVKVSKRNK